jgi:26S proteasome regulatory subunit N4
MLAQPLRRQSNLFDHQHHQQIARPSSRTPLQSWVSSYSTPVDYSFSSNYLQPSGADQSSLLDYNTQQNFNNLRIQVDTPYDSSQKPELMHSEQTVAPPSWNFMNGQLTPTSARTHYRESSLSSLGSAGPASPYNGSTPHPHVLLPSDSETNYDGLPLIDQASYHTFSKPLTPSHTPSQDNFLVPSYQQSYNLSSYNANSHIAALIAMQRQQQASGDDESMPASDYGHSGRPSVASTHESPATPPVAGEYEDQSRKIGEPTSIFMDEWSGEYLPFDLLDFRSVSAIPKLDRTMSDVYNDELYSPSFTFTSAPSTKVENMPMSHPQSAVFSQMLQAANNQHLSASSRSPLGDQGRDQKIAFREGSPLAPISNSFGSPQIRFGSAQQIRERQKAENDDRILQQQMQRTSPVQTAPKTISPRDALLDYHETEEESAMPLFPPQKSPYGMQTHTGREQGQSDMEDTASQQSFGSMATSRRESSSAYSTSSHTTQQGNGFTFAPPSVPGGIRVPQQYPFVPQQRRQPSNMSNLTDRSPEFPSTLSSMESSSSEYRPDSSDLKKPAGSNADVGTYTCTYHGCTLRFETPAKLQKHKREGHRQSAPLVSGTSTAATTQSQAGPHICRRLNPSSGKQCNVVFSRPYDLTRHEDTIHNVRKVKVRCPLCKEEKTFSRGDALTRHLKSVHPLL